MWAQRELQLSGRSRGFHLVTGEILDGLPEVAQVEVGLLHVFMRHTSASMTLNENASAAVLHDFRSWFDDAVPEDAPYWTHRSEGSEDMPAHIKTALLGSSLTAPIAQGQLAVGRWQGIYLCEHRDNAGPRTVTLTVWGEERSGG